MNVRQDGFTLIELLVATAVMAVLAAIGASVMVPQYRSGINDKTIGEIYTIQEAAQNYFVDNNDLPGGSNCSNALNVLRNQDYLLAIDDTSPWNTNYRTNCPGERFQVSVDIPDPYDQRALNTLVDAAVSGNTVTSSVPTPNMLPAVDDFLSRNSSDPSRRTMEADILMGGNNLRNAGTVEADSLQADTGDFSGELEANRMLLTGGDLVTNGGDIDLGGGDVTNARRVVLRNGVRMISGSGQTLRIDADQTRIDNELRVDGQTDLNGDLDVAGSITADDVMTREGVRLTESLQGTDILKVRPTAGFSDRIDAPNCAPGTTPTVFSAPVRVGGGAAMNETVPMGSISTRMVRMGSYYQLRMEVTDTGTLEGHRPPSGLDYALAFTRCER